MNLNDVVNELYEQGIRLSIIEEIPPENPRRNYEARKFTALMDSGIVVKQVFLKVYQDSSSIEKYMMDIAGYRRMHVNKIPTVRLLFPYDRNIPRNLTLLTEYRGLPVNTLARCSMVKSDYERALQYIAANMARVHKITDVDFGPGLRHAPQDSLFDYVLSTFEKKITMLEEQGCHESGLIQRLYTIFQGAGRIEGQLQKPKYELVHGNLDFTNILVEPKGSFVSFIDWKYSFFGDRHYDVSYFLRWLNDGTDIRRQKKLFLDTYTKSYGEALNTDLLDFFDDIHVLRMSIIKIIEKYEDSRFMLQSLMNKYGLPEAR